MSLYRDARRLLAPYRQAFRAQRDRLGERDRLDNLHIAMLLAWTLRQDDSAVDVGCHEGAILRHICRLAPAGRHVAIEPQPALAAALRAQYPGVEVIEAAAAEREGEATFHMDPDAPGYSSLHDRRPGHTRLLTVRTVRIDEVVPADRNVAVLKIDVEGAELAALRGAEGLLRRCRPTIVLEHGATGDVRPPPESPVIHDLLDGLGYRVLDIDGGGPYSRDEFVDRIVRGGIWNWVCIAEIRA